MPTKANVGGTTRRDSVHNSSGISRSTRSVMHGSTNDHAIRNGV